MSHSPYDLDGGPPMPEDYRDTKPPRPSISEARVYDMVEAMVTARHRDEAVARAKKILREAGVEVLP